MPNHRLAMPLSKIVVLTALAMVAFAANSLLCRLALAHTAIDAASFTSIRIVSGALVLGIIVWSRGDTIAGAGSWPSALALFAYAAGFSFAYVSLSAATGTLLLFGAVQTTMIGFGLWKGERMQAVQLAGLLLAVGGLVGLLLPGLSAPPWLASMTMIFAGIAWGIYSLRAKGAGNPTRTTAGNFVRAVPFAAPLSLLSLSQLSFDGAGYAYAVASGALASGLGYAIWYAALRGLTATTAATVQLSVPVIASLGGVVFLGESITVRLLVAAAAILGGIALIVLRPLGRRAV
jgi:drug/metabolite transporter (DMT)-like permease